MVICSLKYLWDSDSTVKEFRIGHTNVYEMDHVLWMTGLVN